MIPIGGFPVPEEFASIRSTDALLALGIGRRTRSLGSILLSAREAEASVVLVTDQTALGASDRADVTLRCRTHGIGVFESAVAPVSLLTYLCSSLALRLGEGRARPAAVHRSHPSRVGRPARRGLSLIAAPKLTSTISIGQTKSTSTKYFASPVKLSWRPNAAR